MAHSGSTTQQPSALGALFNRWRHAANALPGADYARQQADRVQARFLRELKTRMEHLDDGNTPAVSPSPQAPTPATDDTAPAMRMQILMEQSLNQQPASAEQHLCLRILDQLVPDETRIIAALSDGGQCAACHVEATSRLGTSSIRILRNASRVGNDAGVTLLDWVPHYLTHLMELGLVQQAPENKTLATQYEMLATDSAVRKTAERIETELHMHPRIARYALELSSRGQRFWELCQLAH